MPIQTFSYIISSLEASTSNYQKIVHSLMFTYNARMKDEQLSNLC